MPKSTSQVQNEFEGQSKIKITDSSTSRAWARSVKASGGVLSGGKGMLLSRDEAEQLYAFLHTACRDLRDIRTRKNHLHWRMWYGLTNTEDSYILLGGYFMRLVVNVLEMPLPGQLTENGNYGLRLDLCEHVVAILDETVGRARIAEPLAEDSSISLSEYMICGAIFLGLVVLLFFFGLRGGAIGGILSGLYVERILRQKREKRLAFYGGVLPQKTRTSSDHTRMNDQDT